MSQEGEGDTHERLVAELSLSLSPAPSLISPLVRSVFRFDNMKSSCTGWINKERKHSGALGIANI